MAIHEAALQPAHSTEAELGYVLRKQTTAKPLNRSSPLRTLSIASESQDPEEVGLLVASLAAQSSGQQSGGTPHLGVPACHSRTDQKPETTWL